MDHVIKLENNAKLPVSPLYAYNKEELRYEKKTINKLLNRGWIRPLKSPVVSNIIFARRYNKKLRIYINYHTLNTNIVKNRYPLPLINEILRIMAGAIYFTRINLRMAYWFIQMVKGKEWKITFRTYYRLYKWCVIPFGLINTPATI